MAMLNDKGKGMSSRLLSMKFMQRSAAAVASNPPRGTLPPEAGCSVERPSKRVRCSLPGWSTSAAIRSSGESALVQDLEAASARAVRAAVAEDEMRLQQTLERQALEAGDSKWRLDVPESFAPPPLFCTSVGYGDIDMRESKIVLGDGDAQGEKAAVLHPGRMSFGVMKRKRESWQQQEPGKPTHERNPDDAGKHDSQSEPESSEGGSGHSSGPLKASSLSRLGDALRERRKQRVKDERQDAGQRADRRRQQKIKLNAMTSISAGGGGSGAGRDLSWGANGGTTVAKTNGTCSLCGSSDHIKAQCPRHASRQSGEKSIIDLT